MKDRPILFGGPMVPLTVCLVGCGSTKRTKPSAAQDLYTGPLFRKARAWAAGCDAWWIVSGLHGLVSPGSVLAPYEYRLEKCHASQWGYVVANALVHELRDAGPSEVIILAGEDYAHPILTALRSFSGPTWRGGIVAVYAPLRGLGLGKRLAWLSSDEGWAAYKGPGAGGAT